MTEAPDLHLRLGMSAALLRLDLEAAVDVLCEAADAQGVGVHVSHLVPHPSARPLERHADAARELLVERGLVPSTLNVTGDFAFDPFGGELALEASARMVAQWLRLGAAMDAPRVMMWDGVTDHPAEASRLLGECIERGRELAALDAPPPVTVELHPFTFALAHGVVDDLAAVLRAVGDAWFCFDLAHCAVALGEGFLARLPPSFFSLVGEVHWCDSDASTSELHLPPGHGVVDLDAAGRTFERRPVPILWDLYGWPAPREAMRRYRDVYGAVVTRHSMSLGR